VYEACVQDTAKQEDAWMRSIAALAVVALHALLIFEIGRLRRSAYEVENSADDAMTLVMVPSVLDKVSHDTTNEVESKPSSSLQRNAEVSHEPQLAIDPERDRKPGINWRANAARSAQLVVEDNAKDRYRSFGPREQLDSDVDAPRSVFPEPKHQLGEIGEDPYGDPAVWLSDSCFQELDKPVPTARDVFTIISMVKCVMKIGKRPANGELFEHIRKPEEPRPPAHGTEMNPLPREIQPGEVFER
jgi:hypothetical protein